jgi:hypothetical protein
MTTLNGYGGQDPSRSEEGKGNENGGDPGT